MKKYFALVVVAIALASCSKKEANSGESNVMLEEPTVTVKDTTVVEESIAVPEASVVDTTAMAK